MCLPHATMSFLSKQSRRIRAIQRQLWRSTLEPFFDGFDMDVGLNIFWKRPANVFNRRPDFLADAFMGTNGLLL
ncbi:MAG: hypothetical protein RLZZ58_1991, partial [Pseudomonadota bacterium]